MFTTMLQMGLLIAFGTFWQLLAPKHIPALAHRRALTDLVFYILLPALVLDVLWTASIDITSMKISLVAMSGLAISALFVLISSGLILFQTSLIINGGEQNYIMATISLYVALYNLFISLLQLLGAFGGRD